MDRRQKHREVVRALGGQKQLEAFRAWLTFRRYAARSVTAYLKNVRLIAIRLGGVRRLDAATTPDLEAVFSSARRGISPQSDTAALMLYYRILGLNETLLMRFRRLSTV
jgi:hypothetical protein